MSKKLSLIFLSVLIAYPLYCIIQLGVTWDVGFHYTLGKDRLDYLFSLGSNEVNTTPYVNKFYTGTYSTISALFVQFFPRKYTIEAIYIFNLSFSILAIFGIYKIAKEFFNKQIAQITFLLCYFNPIFFGHMAINSMDTIVAFANIWWFYTVLRYFKYQQDKQRKNNYVIFSALLLGLGLGIRYTFLLTLVPIFLFIILEIFYFKIFISKKFSKKLFIKDAFIILVVTYFIMVLFWPETHSNIFLMPIKLAIEGLSTGFGPPFILYEEEIFLPNKLPSSYILVNLLYKMPEFIILSFIAFICFFFKMVSYFKNRFKAFKFKIFTIFIILIFPNILLLVNPWGLYDGIRLFLYLIPFICIVPAILFFFLYKMINGNLYKLTLSCFVFLQLFFLFNFFTLSPYQYVYLNLLAGKYSENSKKFENDYWGVSTKELISKISRYDKTLSSSEIKIALCGLTDAHVKKYLKKYKNLKFKLVNNDEDFDFIIMNNRISWDLKNTEIDIQKNKTCFQKFPGEDLINVKRRGLILSRMTKI